MPPPAREHYTGRAALAAATTPALRADAITGSALPAAADAGQTVIQLLRHYYLAGWRRAPHEGTAFAHAGARAMPLVYTAM